MAMLILLKDSLRGYASEADHNVESGRLQPYSLIILLNIEGTYKTDSTTILCLISEDFDAWRRYPSAPEDRPVIDLTTDM